MLFRGNRGGDQSSSTKCKGVTKEILFFPTTLQCIRKRNGRALLLSELKF